MKRFFIFLTIIFVTFNLFPQTVTFKASLKVVPEYKRQSTGLFVKKGEKIQITTKGKWSMWEKYMAVNADGHKDKKLANSIGNWGALLGKVGDGEMFLIGTKKEFICPNSGILYLFPNKGNFKIENPTGSLDIEIQGGSSIDDFISSLPADTIKVEFDSKNTPFISAIEVKANKRVSVYAFGEWNMFDKKLQPTTAAGYDMDMNYQITDELGKTIPWGKLYGAVSTSYGAFFEVFPIGEAEEFTPKNDGPLAFYPNIGGNETNKAGKITLYVVGASALTADDIASADNRMMRIYGDGAIQRINKFRKELGLDPVIYNETLSRTAYNHSKYLVFNNQFADKEDKDKKFFTGASFKDRLKKEGYEGTERPNEMFVLADSYNSAVDLVLDGPYHRMRFMNPDLKVIGYGCAKQGDKMIHTFDLDYLPDEEAKNNTKVDVSFSPAMNSSNNKTSWNGDENPQILKNFTPPLGYPIVVFFKMYQMQKLISATLKNRSGEIVEAYLFSPDQHDAVLSFNGIIIVPKKPLFNNERYEVDITCNVSSVDRVNSVKNFSYGFNTGSEK